jgi:hypothetical protein
MRPMNAPSRHSLQAAGTLRGEGALADAIDHPRQRIKSTTLRQEADRIAAFPDADTVAIYADLRAFSSETLLYQRIFESEKFITWKNGTSHLFLHLDSLDEVLLRIDSIANLLALELREAPTKRMSIRVACRTAVWPADTLGAALKNIWGDGSGVFELAPLRRRDIISALDANQIAVEGFMRALFAAQAVPFAIKPLTLKMLLTVYQRQGDLPNGNIDLYRQGCLALSEEQNKSRRDSGRRGKLNAVQRIRMADPAAVPDITVVLVPLHLYDELGNVRPLKASPTREWAVRQEGDQCHRSRPRRAAPGRAVASRQTGLDRSRRPGRQGRMAGGAFPCRAC